MNSATESAPETTPAKSRFTSELSQVVRRNVQTYTILLALVGIWLIFFFCTATNQYTCDNIKQIYLNNLDASYP